MDFNFVSFGLFTRLVDNEKKYSKTSAFFKVIEPATV